MIRLALVFCVWLACSGNGLEQLAGELQETLDLQWRPADEAERARLERSADLDWYYYRRIDQALCDGERMPLPREAAVVVRGEAHPVTHGNERRAR